MNKWRFFFFFALTIFNENPIDSLIFFGKGVVVGCGENVFELVKAFVLLSYVFDNEKTFVWVNFVEFEKLFDGLNVIEFVK